MYASYQIPKPKNWQDLETLCLVIWRAEWKTTSLKTYGRPGQHQDGVDIFGRFNDGVEIGAIQCKCKEEEKKLTKKIIQNEVDKAKKFQPTIKHYVIATTFDSDVKLDSFVAQLNVDNLAAGSFPVDLFCWQDIERLLEIHTDVRDWYLNLTKIKNQTCEVMVVESNNMTITPIFKRTHYLPQSVNNIQKQQYTVMDLLVPNRLNTISQPYLNKKKAEFKVILGAIFHARCLIKLSLENTSDVTMRDVCVVVRSVPGAKFYYEKEERNLSDGITKLLLIERMRVYDDYVSYYNMPDYHPKEARNLHEFYLEPPLDVEEVDLYVHVTALDFFDDKVLNLKVVPQYHSSTCYIDEKVGQPDEIEPYVEYLYN